MITRITRVTWLAKDVIHCGRMNEITSDANASKIKNKPTIRLNILFYL